MSKPLVTCYLNKSTQRWHANVYWSDGKRRLRPSLFVDAADDPTEAFERFKVQDLPGIIKAHEEAMAGEKAEDSETSTDNPKIADLADWYLNTHLPFIGLAKRTRQKYTSDLRAFELYCRFKHIGRIKQVNMARIQEFTQWLDGEAGFKHKAKTHKNTLGTIRGWLNACIDAGLLDAGPVRKWIMPKVPEPTPQALTRGQLVQLLECVKEQDPEIFPVISLIAWTGLRPSDACSLTWGDVKPDRIEKKLQKTGFPWHFPLTPQVKEALAAAGKPGKPADWVFPYHGKPWSHRSLLRRFCAAARAGEFPLAVHMKLLRTTFATLLARAGCNPKLHQRLMGHRQLETTLKFYTEVDFDMAEEFLERFSADAKH